MKNINFLFLAITLFLAACGGDKTETTTTEGTDAGAAAGATTISVKGSDTVLPVSQKEAEEFMKANAGSAITVVGGGSGTGITALLDGSTDICMSSRELKTDEKLKFQGKSIEVKEAVIGFDALSVIVHPENKVAQLTREQLEKIFTGEIKNWKEVGGADAPIVAYSRESSSGTYEFFKEHVMDKKNYATTVLNMPATGAIVQSVSQTKGAIGYVGLAYVTNGVKPLSVSYDQGKTFVAPSVQGAKDKTYPVARPLYYFYDAKNEAKVKSFVDYVMSDAGQKNVGDAGYVPVR
ncbi:MAG: phosphate ABC transporter substrate-binding protein [Saprospiraceae bacterium]|nr:phosphate ABC transporter substrate-binding protein [Saprospiraceae bacterium]